MNSADGKQAITQSCRVAGASQWAPKAGRRLANSGSSHREAPFLTVDLPLQENRPQLQGGAEDCAFNLSYTPGWRGKGHFLWLLYAARIWRSRSLSPQGAC